MGEARSAPASAKSQVEALFDSLALEYVRERERQFSFVSQKRIAVGMLLGGRGRLLEVGCGPGIMLPDLLAMGCEVHAIDISAEMIRRAEQRMSGHPLARRCHLGVGDVERLEFGEGSFDAVLAMGVLEYLPARAGALREMVRVLKPGGHLVLPPPTISLPRPISPPAGSSGGRDAPRIRQCHACRGRSTASSQTSACARSKARRATSFSFR